MALITPSEPLVRPGRLLFTEVALVTVIGLASATAYVIAFVAVRLSAGPLGSHGIALAAALALNLVLTRTLTYRGATADPSRQVATYAILYLLGLPVSLTQLWGFLSLTEPVAPIVEITFGLIATGTAIAIATAAMPGQRRRSAS